jgi:predicted HTH domain antitoxin
MTTKTLRLPEVLATAVHDVGAREDIEDSTAMRKLLRMGYDAYLAEQYRLGRLTLREMARRMGVSLSEALDVLRQRGINGNVTADDTLESLKSMGVPGQR